MTDQTETTELELRAGILFPDPMPQGAADRIKGIHLEILRSSQARRYGPTIKDVRVTFDIPDVAPPSPAAHPDRRRRRWTPDLAGYRIRNGRFLAIALMSFLCREPVWDPEEDGTGLNVWGFRIIHLQQEALNVWRIVAEKPYDD